MSDPFLEVRKKNFKNLIKESYEGKYDKIATLTGKTEDTLKKYHQPKSRLKFSPQIAREIERALTLPSQYLDKSDNEDKNIYYVMVFVKNSETYNIVEWLYRNTPEVKDCSTVLGEFDIILKIEVPNFHYLELFFNKLKRIPNVMRTQTFASVDSLRWQREQIAYTNLEDPVIEKSFVDYIKNKRISELSQQIQDIEGGEIIAYENSQERISLIEMMKWTKKSFLSVREYKEKIHDPDDYFNEEKKKKEQGIKSKRIFTLPKVILSDKNEINLIMSEAKKLLNIEVEIRFILEEEWTSYKKPECFAIIDDEFVYIRGDSGDKSRLKVKSKNIEHYKNLFEKNWEIGLNYEKFKKKYIDRDLDHLDQRKEELMYPYNS